MCRLNEQLKYFVTMKISTDSLWQNVTVILSGHETPGEGEHKIMDFIRHGEFDSPSPAWILSSFSLSPIWQGNIEN